MLPSEILSLSLSLSLSERGQKAPVSVAGAEAQGTASGCDGAVRPIPQTHRLRAKCPRTVDLSDGFSNPWGFNVLPPPCMFNDGG